MQNDGERKVSDGNKEYTLNRLMILLIAITIGVGIGIYLTAIAQTEITNQIVKSFDKIP